MLFSIRNAKIRYGLGLILLKMLKQGAAKTRLGPYNGRKAKIRYGSVFNSIENAEMR